INIAQTDLQKFCVEISDRSVGSNGNRDATKYFKEKLSSLGWNVETQEFDAFDWEDGGAELIINNEKFNVLVSPYSLGCDTNGELIAVNNFEELQQRDIKGKIVLLCKEIAKEQLMPKNFVFYNPESHQKIIAILEGRKPTAIISATGRNAALAGGVYPFPLIEDGDFNIPSVYTSEEIGGRLLLLEGQIVSLSSSSSRIKEKGYNVIGKKGTDSTGRIVITAHIDSKKGTPGAIDNATGIVILLLLAELLKDYNRDKQIEIVAFNGEDYYAAPGQMEYLRKNQNRFNEIILNINIDGAGYLEGNSAFSFYGMSDNINRIALNTINNINGIVEGRQWVQGDHSIFIQKGCPAIAVSSQWFTDNIDNQTITHTQKDNIDIVDLKKLVEISEALKLIVSQI
ncbi:M28 family peptidase, partial [Candidatus Neomarinimicrobiota bacterium]